MRSDASLWPARAISAALRSAPKRAGLGCFALLMLVFGGPEILRSSRRWQRDYTISVDVNMVVLHVTVQNHKGASVSGLVQDDFQVNEDGVRQEIRSFSHEDIPVTVGLVIDNSGSMRPKRADVIAAALVFAHSSNPEDELFVVNFNERVSFALPTGTPFTSDVPALEQALSRINPDGETALYDAVAASLDHLHRASRDRKALIVISDGGDNASKHTLADILSLAAKSDAIIYTIGVFDESDIDQNPRVLKRLAGATGGEAFFPQSSGNVIPVCRQIAQDLRSQYTIAYVPTNRKRDGGYRSIQVKAAARGKGRLFVRSRPGYYAASAAVPAAPGEGHDNAD